ncbi:MFS transporter [Dactylosporangium sp. CA-233914]|uniref:MFS transporter n=1 Tax=Dactylosporangium sp. CA-233914 TaxID=3239934 RepID=UPI003D8E9929
MIRALLTVVLLAANLRAGIAVVGPLAGLIAADTGGHMAASMMITVSVLCFGLFSPLVPKFSRWWGMEWLIAASLGAVVLGLGVRVIDSMVALWGGTVLAGLGVSALNVVIPALIKRDFSEHIATITGAYMSSQAVAAAIASSTALPLAAISSWGWHLPLSAWGLLGAVALALLIPDLVSRRGGGAPVERAPRSQWSPWASWRGWQMAVFMGAQSTVYYVVLAAWPSIEASIGVPPVLAGVHQGWMQLCSIAGIVLCSALLRWMPADQRAIAWIAVLPLAAILLVVVAPALIVVWNSLIGIAMGVALVHALALFGVHTRDHTQAGDASAMAQSVGYLMAAAGAVGAGLLLGTPLHGGGVLVLIGCVLVVQVTSGVLASRRGFVDDRGRTRTRNAPHGSMPDSVLLDGDQTLSGEPESVTVRMNPGGIE